MKRRVLTSKEGLADYTTCTGFYSLRNIFSNWTNAVLKVRRSSDNATAYVFFDGNEITLSSLISTSSNTTAGVTTLGSWIGASNGFVEEWYSLFSDNIIGHLVNQTTTALQPQIITSGTLNTKNGKNYIYFDGSTYLFGTPLPSLNAISNYTIFSVTHNDASNNASVVLTTSLSNFVRFQHFNDRRTFKRVVIVNSTLSNIALNLIVQDNTDNQRIQGVRVQANRKMLASKDKEYQDFNTYTGTYTNDYFVIGIDVGTSFGMTGGIQEIIVFPNAQHARNMRSIKKEINSHYSVY